MQEAIIELLQKGSIEQIRTSVDKDPIVMRGKDEEGTPLSFYLARRGDLELLRWAVEYSRADLESLDAKGRSILFPAIDSGNLACVRYLVEQVGMDLQEASREGITPLQYANTKDSKIESYLAEVLGYSTEEAYQNPIIRGFSPDPSIVRVGEDYYMVNSSFITFPAIPISHSKDLVHWERIGYALTDPSYLNFSNFDAGRGLWAADISYHEGKFYIVATLRMNDDQMPLRKQMLVTAINPEGPYSAPLFVEEDGIDPSLFFHDGKVYMLLNRGCRIVELDAKTFEKKGEASLLYYGDTKKATEAPHLFYKAPYFYLLMAEGGTGQGHHVNIARSRNVFGPYEACPFNPIMQQKQSEAFIHRAGHGKMLETTDGRWFMVYLAARQYEKELSQFGRESFLTEIFWTEDLWPYAANRRRPSVEAKLPFPERKTEAEAMVKGEERGFGKEKDLPLCWFFVRTKGPNTYVLENGQLYLSISSQMPEEMQAAPILLQRLREPFMNASVNLSLPEENGQRKGLILYYDDFSWIYWAIEKVEDQYYPELIVREGEDEKCFRGQALAKAKKENLLSAKVCIKHCYYEFTFCEAGKEEVLTTQELESRILQDEGLSIGKRFVGPSIGVFAYSPLERSEKTVFTNFTIEEHSYE